MPGITVTVNDQCIGCGACTKNVCFVDAIRMVNDSAVISGACRGCGLCITVCPEKAIEISIANDRFVEESVRRISPLVDIT